jgi:amino acid transporter
VKRNFLVFWGSALAVAVTFAALAAAFLPYESLRLNTAAERERAWLLTVWTGGVISVLFGLSARLGAFTGVGFREVMEAGSVRQAVEMHRERTKPTDSDFARNFDGWLMTTGGMMIAIYFVAWLALR